MVLRITGQGGGIEHRGNVRSSHPAVLGLILGSPKIFIILDVASIYQQALECGKIKKLIEPSCSGRKKLVKQQKECLPIQIVHLVHLLSHHVIQQSYQL